MSALQERSETEDAAVRIGFLRAALDRLQQGEFRSPSVMAGIARAALALDDTLRP